ncbi:procathepsin L-like [Cydia amplana]|uniref:procathepsin L-like n=1 Tax=Cydia amplana TaxID=1869771 RepID=UPI002FE575BE
MNCAVLLLSVAAVGVFSFDSYNLVRQEWEVFKLEHKKQYSSMEEDKERMKIYVDNKWKVAQHNKAHAQGHTSFTLALNEFSDHYPREIQRMRGYKPKVGRPTAALQHHSLPPDDLPLTMNWVSKGAVTGVKNQGACGSCWAFSATGALEGQYFRKTGRLVSLSEQNLLDCSEIYGNDDGCVNGGVVVFAYTYVAGNGGISMEKYYPYKKVQGLCRYNPKYSSNMTVKGFQDLPYADEGYLQSAVANIGPISMSMDASQKSFELYKDGVYFDKNCSSTDLDHSVLVVGYGTEQPGGDYWLVKNSWGKTWGMKGYMKLARNRGNHCGVATEPTYPLL